jgi:hypothetical protein
LPRASSGLRLVLLVAISAALCVTPIVWLVRGGPHGDVVAGVATANLARIAAAGSTFPLPRVTFDGSAAVRVPITTFGSRAGTVNISILDAGKRVLKSCAYPRGTYRVPYDTLACALPDARRIARIRISDGGSGSGIATYTALPAGRGTAGYVELLRRGDAWSRLRQVLDRLSARRPALFSGRLAMLAWLLSTVLLVASLVAALSLGRDRVARDEPLAADPP